MKVGRNAPCPCGSGIKFKKCCFTKREVYLFEVNPLEIENFNCTIGLHSDHTLCDLHYYIQRALGWDDDHMYSFFLDNKLWSKDFEYSANPLGEGSANIKLGELNLRKNQKLAYLFDYGDSHRFEIKVAQAQLVDREAKTSVGVINQAGERPEQYELYENDEIDSLLSDPVETGGHSQDAQV